MVLTVVCGNLLFFLLDINLKIGKTYAGQAVNVSLFSLSVIKLSNMYYFSGYYNVTKLSM